jgi:hypothetical protein
MGNKLYSNQETTCWIRPEALHWYYFEVLWMSKGSPDLTTCEDFIHISQTYPNFLSCIINPLAVVLNDGWELTRTGIEMRAIKFPCLNLL